MLSVPVSGVRQESPRLDMVERRVDGAARGQSAHQGQREEEWRQPRNRTPPLGRQVAVRHDEGDRHQRREQQRPALRVVDRRRACPRQVASGAVGVAGVRRRQPGRHQDQPVGEQQPADHPAGATEHEQPADHEGRQQGQLEDHQLDDSAGVPAAGALEGDVDGEDDEIQERGRDREHPPRPHARDDPRGAEPRQQCCYGTRRRASGRRPPCARCRGSRSSSRGRRGWSSRSAPTR